MAKISFWVDVFLKGISWWLIPLVTLFIYKKILSKYPIECVIYEKRGENLVYNRDVAGRFEFPVTCYRLKKSGDTIPIPQYDWILQYTAKPTNIFEKLTNILSGKIGTITLFKYGSKQYKPINAKMGEEKRRFKEVRDKNGLPVWITVYEPINVKKEMSRLDFEVIDWDDMNHMTQEIRASIQRRAQIKDWLAKYGPIVSMALGAFILLICGYLGYDFLMEAGDHYATAAKGGAPTPQPSPAENLPLGDLLPD